MPQIVVVVTRIRASSGPTSGIGFSSSTMRPGSTKIGRFHLRHDNLLHETSIFAPMARKVAGQSHWGWATSGR